MSDAQIQALRAIVETETKANPVELDGFSWCALPQPEIAEQLGCSVSTLRRIISKKPFVRECALIGEAKVKTLLLREGDPDAMTPRRMAKALRNIWVEKTGKKTTAKDFGLFVGLATDWPKGWQTKLLKFVLEEWQFFMAGVGCWIAIKNDEAEEEGQLPPYKKRYYRYPTLSVVRRFWGVAIEAYEIALQSEGMAKFHEFAKAMQAQKASS